MARAVSDAVIQAQNRCSLPKVALYGHSGGGALAVLAAPSLLPSLCCLGTIASPLDTELWTRLLGTKALKHSLNPKGLAKGLFSVPQLHLAGGKDEIVPPRVLDSWLEDVQPLPAWIRRVLAPEAGHQGPWAQTWRQVHARLMEQIRIFFGGDVCTHARFTPRTGVIS
jgi:pimeloyl-ACP methyl ester carboxylesterase